MAEYYAKEDLITFTQLEGDTNPLTNQLCLPNKNYVIKVAC